MYSSGGPTPFSLTVNASTACDCYTTCFLSDVCAYRKYCAASVKRFVCQSSALVAFDTSNPCPSPPSPPSPPPPPLPPPPPITLRDYWATVPSSGNLCVVYTSTPAAGLMPYSYTNTSNGDCGCYRACRADYSCDGRTYCPDGTNRKDCRDANVTLDHLGASNPCPT